MLDSLDCTCMQGNGRETKILKKTRATDTELGICMIHRNLQLASSRLSCQVKEWQKNSVERYKEQSIFTIYVISFWLLLPIWRHQDGNKAGEAKMLPKKHFVHQMKRMNGLKNPVVWPMVTALQHTDSSRSGAKNPTCFGSCLVLRALSSSCQFTPVPSLMKQGPGASACSLNQKTK